MEYGQLDVLHIKDCFTLTDYRGDDMNENIIVALITGVMTLLGVLASNQTAQAAKKEERK